MPPRPRSGRRIAFADEDIVVGVEWPTFLAWFASVWKQGQHVALVGPTGCGKTTAEIGLCGLRRWVLGLDAKGGDDTLALAGWQQVDAWPPSKKIRNDIAEGRPARLVAGFSPETIHDRVRLTEFLQKVMEAAWIDRNWTLGIDELQLMADRKMMGLGPLVEEFLVAARTRGVSVVSCFQAPAWVPTASTRQATWIGLFPTTDTGVIKTLAEKIGRDWHDLEAVLHELPDHHMVMCGQNPKDPMVLTRPEKIGG